MKTQSNHQWLSSLTAENKQSLALMIGINERDFVLEFEAQSIDEITRFSIKPWPGSDGQSAYAVFFKSLLESTQIFNSALITPLIETIHVFENTEFIQPIILNNDIGLQLQLQAESTEIRERLQQIIKPISNILGLHRFRETSSIELFTISDKLIELLIKDNYSINISGIAGITQQNAFLIHAQLGTRQTQATQIYLYHNIDHNTATLYLSGKLSVVNNFLDNFGLSFSLLDDIDLEFAIGKISSEDNSAVLSRSSLKPLLHEAPYIRIRAASDTLLSPLNVEPLRVLKIYELIRNQLGETVQFNIKFPLSVELDTPSLYSNPAPWNDSSAIQGVTMRKVGLNVSLVGKSIDLDADTSLDLKLPFPDTSSFLRFHSNLKISTQGISIGFMLEGAITDPSLPNQLSTSTQPWYPLGGDKLAVSKLAMQLGSIRALRGELVIDEAFLSLIIVNHTIGTPPDSGMVFTAYQLNFQTLINVIDDSAIKLPSPLANSGINELTVRTANNNFTHTWPGSKSTTEFKQGIYCRFEINLLGAIFSGFIELRSKKLKFFAIVHEGIDLGGVIKLTRTSSHQPPPFALTDQYGKLYDISQYSGPYLFTDTNIGQAPAFAIDTRLNLFGFINFELNSHISDKGIAFNLDSNFRVSDMLESDFHFSIQADLTRTLPTGSIAGAFRIKLNATIPVVDINLVDLEVGLAAQLGFNGHQLYGNFSGKFVFWGRSLSFSLSAQLNVRSAADFANLIKDRVIAVAKSILDFFENIISALKDAAKAAVKLLKDVTNKIKNILNTALASIVEALRELAKQIERLLDQIADLAVDFGSFIGVAAAQRKKRQREKDLEEKRKQQKRKQREEQEKLRQREAEYRKRDAHEQETLTNLARAAVLDDNIYAEMIARITAYQGFFGQRINPFTNDTDWRHIDRGYYFQRWQQAFIMAQRERAQLDAIRELVEQLNELSGNLKFEISSAQAQIEQGKNDLINLNSRHKGLKIRIKRLQEKMASLDTKIDHTSSDLSINQQLIASIASQRKHLESEISRLNKLRLELQAQRDITRRTIQSQQQQLDLRLAQQQRIKELLDEHPLLATSSSALFNESLWLANTNRYAARRAINSQQDKTNHHINRPEKASVIENKHALQWLETEDNTLKENLTFWKQKVDTAVTDISTLQDSNTENFEPLPLTILNNKTFGNLQQILRISTEVFHPMVVPSQAISLDLLRTFSQYQIRFFELLDTEPDTSLPEKLQQLYTWYQSQTPQQPLAEDRAQLGALRAHSSYLIHFMESFAQTEDSEALFDWAAQHGLTSTSWASPSYVVSLTQLIWHSMSHTQIKLDKQRNQLSSTSLSHLIDSAQQSLQLLQQVTEHHTRETADSQAQGWWSSAQDEASAQASATDLVKRWITQEQQLTQLDSNLSSALEQAHSLTSARNAQYHHLSLVNIQRHLLLTERLRLNLFSGIEIKLTNFIEQINSLNTTAVSFIQLAEQQGEQQATHNLELARRSSHLKSRLDALNHACVEFKTLIDQANASQQALEKLMHLASQSLQHTEELLNSASSADSPNIPSHNRLTELSDNIQAQIQELEQQIDKLQQQLPTAAHQLQQAIDFHREHIHDPDTANDPRLNTRPDPQLENDIDQAIAEARRLREQTLQLQSEAQALLNQLLYANQQADEVKHSMTQFNLVNNLFVNLIQHMQSRIDQHTDMLPPQETPTAQWPAHDILFELSLAIHQLEHNALQRNELANELNQSIQRRRATLCINFQEYQQTLEALHSRIDITESGLDNSGTLFARLDAWHAPIQVQQIKPTLSAVSTTEQTSRHEKQPADEPASATSRPLTGLKLEDMAEDRIHLLFEASAQPGMNNFAGLHNARWVLGSKFDNDTPDIAQSWRLFAQSNLAQYKGDSPACWLPQLQHNAVMRLHVLPDDDSQNQRIALQSAWSGWFLSLEADQPCFIPPLEANHENEEGKAFTGHIGISLNSGETINNDSFALAGDSQALDIELVLDLHNIQASQLLQIGAKDNNALQCRILIDQQQRLCFQVSYPCDDDQPVKTLQAYSSLALDSSAVDTPLHIHASWIKEHQHQPLSIHWQTATIHSQETIDDANQQLIQAEPGLQLGGQLGMQFVELIIERDSRIQPRPLKTNRQSEGLGAALCLLHWRHDYRDQQQLLDLSGTNHHASLPAPCREAGLANLNRHKLNADLAIIPQAARLNVQLGNDADSLQDTVHSLILSNGQGQYLGYHNNRPALVQQSSALPLHVLAMAAQQDDDLSGPPLQTQQADSAIQLTGHWRDSKQLGLSQDTELAHSLALQRLCHYLNSEDEQQWSQALLQAWHEQRTPGAAASDNELNTHKTTPVLDEQQLAMLTALAQQGLVLASADNSPNQDWQRQPGRWLASLFEELYSLADRAPDADSYFKLLASHGLLWRGGVRSATAEQRQQQFNKLQQRLLGLISSLAAIDSSQPGQRLTQQQARQLALILNTYLIDTQQRSASYSGDTSAADEDSLLDDIVIDWLLALRYIGYELTAFLESQDSHDMLTTLITLFRDEAVDDEGPGSNDNNALDNRFMLAGFETVQCTIELDHLQHWLSAIAQAAHHCSSPSAPLRERQWQALQELEALNAERIALRALLPRAPQGWIRHGLSHNRDKGEAEIQLKEFLSPWGSVAQKALPALSLKPAQQGLGPIPALPAGARRIRCKLQSRLPAGGELLDVSLCLCHLNDTTQLVLNRATSQPGGEYQQWLSAHVGDRCIATSPSVPAEHNHWHEMTLIVDLDIEDNDSKIKTPATESAHTADTCALIQHLKLELELPRSLGNNNGNNNGMKTHKQQQTPAPWVIIGHWPLDDGHEQTARDISGWNRPLSSGIANHWTAVPINLEPVEVNDSIDVQLQRTAS